MNVLTTRQKYPINKSINSQISHREVTRFLGKQYFEQNMVHLTLSPYTKVKWLTRQDRQSRITLSLTQLFVFVLSIHMGWHFGRFYLPWQGKKHGSLPGKLIGKSGKKEAGRAKCLLMKAPGEWNGGGEGKKLQRQWLRRCLICAPPCEGDSLVNRISDRDSPKPSRSA